METNTVNNTNNTTTTETVATTQVKVKKTVKTSGAKLGRKPTPVTEIVGKEFSISDLESINQNVKLPTIRSYVARNVAAGRFELVKTLKSGSRGKPANIYRIK